MAEDTKADANSIKTAATKIGQVADEVNPDELKDIQVHPGVFQAGMWLKQLVASRTATLEAHTRELQMAMHEIDEKLKIAANQIVGVDQDNGENVKKVEGTLDELKSGIGNRSPNLLEDDPNPVQQA